VRILYYSAVSSTRYTLLSPAAVTAMGALTPVLAVAHARAACRSAECRSPGTQDTEALGVVLASVPQ
jgi:hypothetical protein